MLIILEPIVKDYLLKKVGNVKAAVGCGGGPRVVVVVGWGAGDETGGAGVWGVGSWK